MQDLSPSAAAPPYTIRQSETPESGPLVGYLVVTIVMTQHAGGLATPAVGPPPRFHCHTEDTTRGGPTMSATVLHIEDPFLKSPSGR